MSDCYDSPQVVVNALALFWVTDSISERSAAGPRSGATGTMDHPVYEMSSGGSHKDPGASVHDMVSTPRRHSRNSWSPFNALDRGIRVLFVREPERREADAVDVEVSVHSLINPPRTIVKVENSDCGPHRDQCRHFLSSRFCQNWQKERKG